MALFECNPQKICHSRYVCIPAYQTEENVTKYTILITIGKHYWSVNRRYSEFHQLNEKLSADNIIDRSLLPPKKIFGNQTESFIHRRKADLEQYLKAIFTLEPLPQALVLFLEFEKYEIHAITESLAAHLWENGDTLLQANEVFHMSPLQCHALTEQLKLPKSMTSGSKNPKTDVGHVLDFLCKVCNLIVCGSNKPAGSSNVVPNQLPFSLILFKNLQSFKLVSSNPEMLKGFVNVRKTVVKLQIQDSLTSLKQIFLNETVHWDPDNISRETLWPCVTHADFSYNHLENLDNSIHVLPYVEYLDLSQNQISSINYLDHLSHLRVLDLSHNCFTTITDLHTKLGNLVTLKMAGNRIDSLSGFQKLYSLVDLDLQNNLILAITEIRYLVNLPCLEKLNLTGNPIVNSVDYRTRVLEQFNSRVIEMSLDNQKPTQKELDTVAILQAIRRAKEGAAKTQIPSSFNPDVCIGGELATKTDEEARRRSELDEFRQQVALIRAQGGSGWLRLWNQRQVEREERCRPKEVINSSVKIGITAEDSRIHPPASSNPLVDSCRDLILPDWLPDCTDKDFLISIELYLIEVLSYKIECKVEMFFWAVIVWSPSRIRCCTFPACLVALPSYLVIFLLSDLQDGRRPHLLPFRCISAKSVSSITLGFHYHFLRFEEKNTDDISEYVLLFATQTLCKSFANVLSTSTKLEVKKSVLKSSVNGRNFSRAQFYTWVALDMDVNQQNEGTIICIGMMGNEVTLLRERVCSLVQNSPEKGENIELLASWDLKKEIVDLEMHGGLTLWKGTKKSYAEGTDRDNVKIVSTSNSAVSSAFTISNRVKEILCEAGYGVTVWFIHSDYFSVRFASREYRDLFLDALTHARKV